MSYIRLAESWTVRSSNPVRNRDFLFSIPFQTCLRTHAAFSATGTVPGVKRPDRGVDHRPYLTPRLKMSRAIPFPFSVCTDILQGDLYL